MKRSTLKPIILLISLVFALACKSKKIIVEVPPVKSADTLNIKKVESINLLKSKDVNYNSLSLRGKANLNINGDVNNVNMIIRIKKDQKIWISITAIAGIEVARAMITPDSILVLNKLQSTYLSRPFNFIHIFTNKQINFKTLQSIISGNTISDFALESAKLDLINGVWTLNGKRENLAYRILFNTLLKVAETNLNDVNSGQALKVNYGTYLQLNSYLFPSSLKINSISGKNRISIDLNFSKIESNVPIDFPFTVPKRYTVIN